MSLAETRRRELLRESVARRRAGQPRRLKVLDPTARRLIAAAVRLRSAPLHGAVAPSDAAIAMAARGLAPTTWNRYASTLTRWEAYAAGAGTPFLPADPTHFANFLAAAAVGALSATQTKHRSCAIHALSGLAGVPSPVADALVRDVRSGVRRALRGTRGRARPIFTHEIPTADALPSPPSGRGGGPRRLAPGAAVAPLSVRKRARAQAMRCAATLEAAALRFDDIIEAQIGDAVVNTDHIDLSVFGTKTDAALTGQAAVLPGPAVAGSGAHAFLEGVRLGLSRLAALPAATLVPLAARFRAACSVRERGRGAMEFATYPADIQALAAPLYAVGLPVHCLPLYGQWQHARLDAETDLREGVTRSTFLALSSHVLSSVGVDAAGLGGHSFRRGRAIELFHNDAPYAAVTEVLRHRSPASTRPYVSDAARLAALAATMTAATAGRRPAPGAVRRPGGAL